MTSPLFRTNNPYYKATHFTPRPSRQDAKWRYASEPDLIRAQDAWDAAKEVARQTAELTARIDADMAKRQAEADKAVKEREDQLTNDEFKRRYLSAGGDPAQFEKDLPELRREHAKRVALGQDQPIDGVAVLKQELRERMRNVGRAPDPA